MNIIGCAMLGAFVLCMPQRPDAEALTVYYENAQMTPLMKWFCRKSGKSKFTAKDMAAMKATAALNAADRALDVVSTEPIQMDNPLLGAKNVILTPHIAWAPKESRQRLMDIAVDNLKCYVDGKPQNVVNV